MLRSWFHRVVLRRLWLTYIVMGLAFLLFGCGTLNLIHLLQANVELVSTYGWMALADGAFQQLLELLFSGYAALLAYIVFKACEYRLVHWLGDK
ncbi:MAG TPA: hypothetical protein VGM81_12690 [Burkholderiaceae bacterium]|jgi:uncharacterized membrane protein HdeD (DUF308 family)